jgi:predicted thioesterase
VEVGYRAPTPLGVRLAVSARLDRVDGRKLFVSGQVAVAGVVTAQLAVAGAVTAQANAVFVKLTRASVASIFPTSRVPRA